MHLRFLAGAVAVPGALAAHIPHTYMVEFANGHNIESFYRGLELGGIKFSPRLNMTYSLFQGASFELADGGSNSSLSDIISKMPTVKHLWPVGEHQTPVDTTNSTSLPVPRDTGTGMKTGKRQDGNDTYSPHVMTQVARLHARGITGKGIKVAVIDSGIDYKHPALGGCFGPGCLVGYGRNVLGELRPGGPEPVDDPIDPCNGHGTHVAGIIAARPNPLGFTGAAPGVTLGAYRASTCTGSVDEDVLIAALNRAHDDGSDVINLSLTFPFDWSEHPVGVAAQRVVEKGTPVVAAMGNSGETGLWTSGNPALARGAAGVANFFNTETPAIHVVASYSAGGRDKTFSWQAGDPAMPNVSLPLFATSFDALPDDGCRDLPAGTDLSGYVVLVRGEDRSTDCRIVNKMAKLSTYGAKYVLVYSLTEYTTPLNLFPKNVDGVGMVPNSRGQEWISLLRAGTRVVVDVITPGAAQQTAYSPPNTETGGLMSTRSSWGMSWELDVKPTVGAPGQNILSTYLLSRGGYRIDSGTSMASPFVAAVYALVAEARGKLDPAALQSLVSTTAKPNVYYDGRQINGGILAPVVQQGGGLVQAYDAAFATTLVNVSSIAFNDTDHFVPTHRFSITNLGSAEVTYTLGHVRAATVYALSGSYLDDPGSFRLAPTPLETVDAWASLSFSSNSVKIAPGGSASVSVTGSFPTALEKGRLPVYSGFVSVNSSSGESLSIPYAGVATSMRSIPILSTDPDLTQLARWDLVNLGDIAPQPENTTFTIPVPTGEPNGDQNPDFGLPLPVAIYGRTVGTAYFRLDIVPLEVDGPLETTVVLGTRIAGSAERYPMRFYPGRGSTIDPFRGMLSDGRVVPEGRYRFLMRTLRVFGDPDNKDDYDALELPAFYIRYQ